MKVLLTSKKNIFFLQRMNVCCKYILIITLNDIKNHVGTTTECRHIFESFLQKPIKVILDGQLKLDQIKLLRLDKKDSPQSLTIKKSLKLPLDKTLRRWCISLNRHHRIHYFFYFVLS